MLHRPNQLITTLGLRILAAALSFGFGIVAARLLGVDDFGIVSVLLGIVNVGIVLSLLGHETLATREIASLHQREATGDTAALKYSRSAAKQVWLAGIVVVTMTMIITSLLPIGQLASTKFLLLILLIPLIARTRLSQAFIRGAHRAGLSLVPDGIVRPGLAIIGLAAVIYAENNVGYNFAAIMIACAVIGLIIGMIWERRVLLRLPQTTITSSNTSTVAVKGRHFSTHIFVSSILAVLMSQIALISIGLLSTPVDAGLYAAAERFSLAAALIGQTIYLATASHFAALNARGEKEQLRALIRKVTRNVSGATLLICVVFGLSAELLLKLYGANFSDAVPILLILLIPVLFNACIGPTGVLLLMTNNERHYFQSLVIGCLLQFVLVLALVPTFGAIGAAITVLIATLASNVLMAFYVRKQLYFNIVLFFA